MRDATTDEYQPLGDHVCADHPAGDACEKTAQKSVPEERIFK
jgi:hypothetical protein